MNVDAGELAKQALKAAEIRKAEEPVVFDMRGVSDLCDYQLVCSGANTRQTRAICEAIVEQVRAEFEITPLVIEGRTRGDWISLDYGYVIVHVFCREVRERYQFDALWKEVSTSGSRGGATDFLKNN